MGALVARWRVSMSQGDAREDGPAGPWLSRILVGRSAAVLFWCCGVSGLVSLVGPSDVWRPAEWRLCRGCGRRGRGSPQLVPAVGQVASLGRSPPGPRGLRAGGAPDHARKPRQSHLRGPLRPALRLDRRRVSARDGTRDASAVRGGVLAAPDLRGAALGSRPGLRAVRRLGLSPGRRAAGMALDETAVRPRGLVAVSRHGERHRCRACLGRGSGETLVVDRAGISARSQDSPTATSIA